ncbi:MAG TPA: DUF5655 domain-containing protein [Verrucomicrobiae bacterium]|nr:DUF5655 domain-containing protein [Verrucomicrobiae bacterium]
MEGNWTIDTLFGQQPTNLKLFNYIKRQIEACGDVKLAVTKTQASFGVKRKFAWVWATPATKKQPEGTLMLTLDMLEKETDNRNLIREIIKYRDDKWTHQIPIQGIETIDTIAQLGWFEEAYKFGLGTNT